MPLFLRWLFHHALGFIFPISCHAVVYIVPIAGLDARKLFFDPYSYRDEVARPFCELVTSLENDGFSVEITYDAADLKNVEAIIVFNEYYDHLLSNLNRYPKSRCFLFVFEPPVVQPHLYQNDYTPYFGKIFTMFDDLVDNRCYFKFYYPQPHLKIMVDIPEFEEKKFCVMIASNKVSSHKDEIYSERQKIIAFFEDKDEFDLYGSGWSGKHAKGFINSKWETMKNYKFSFTYDNMHNQRGYITEKIFDSFVSGCIPVYLGASNITDYIPKNCFVDKRDFATYEELYLYLKSMTKETYNEYIDNIKLFLVSDKALLYSTENFVQLIRGEIALCNQEGRYD